MKQSIRVNILVWTVVTVARAVLLSMIVFTFWLLVQVSGSVNALRARVDALEAAIPVVSVYDEYFAPRNYVEIAR